MILALLLCATQATPQTLLDTLRTCLATGDATAIQSSFVKPDDSKYLFEMASSRGGLKKLRICIFTTPPGWERTGPCWATFYTFQDLEEDHDPIYPLVHETEGWKLGAEIPPWECGSERITRADVDVTIDPPRHSAEVESSDELQTTPGAFKSPVFRLNDIYLLKQAGSGEKAIDIVTADDMAVASPKEGAVLRAGGLVIPYVKQPISELRFDYSGVVNQPGQDHITTKCCYLTAGWLPTLANLPFKSHIRIEGVPKGWTIRSEGKRVRIHDSNRLVYATDFPISFHKVIGGDYVIAAEKTDNGRTFTAWQFEPVDRARADATVDRMVEAAKFYDKNLVPFPYPGYDCFDGDDYYGIESYSYTLLAPKITVRYVAHEMGHTYLGGLTPCGYLHDSWNEGVTTYVDDVLTGREVDHPLESAINTLDVHVPLAQMGPAHSFRGASYWRGAAVMKMLEHEIGAEGVLRALRAVIRDRAGKETTWDDLRPYFEVVSGRHLAWFWDQWIDHADFPTLKPSWRISSRGVGLYLSACKLSQSGTSQPYQQWLLLSVRGGGKEYSKEVHLTEPEREFFVTTPFEPKSFEVKVAGWTLARVAK